MARASSTPPELPGYRFVSLLGSGGFSDVFLYEQQLPRRRVAVKVLLLEELTDASRAAFTAEANLMAQLSSHPYIVTIYQADVAADGRPYLVMEYCSGPSLGERYKRAPLDVVEALRTGVRLASAVAVAHQAGILHRDIKPANVLSNDYGWPALTDFGISSAVDDELPLHTTTFAHAEETGATGGTSSQVGLSVPWSPPEMFEDDPDPDVRSDVFSLAATIWTVLAGQTPFEVKGRSNGMLDLIGRIERGAITPMSRDDVPRSLMAVLQKGLASDRSQRFASAVEFGRALQRVELELGYSRTELEIPNRLIESPEPASDGDAADETRVRSVATIAAQASPPPVAAPHSADATQVRGAPQVVRQAPSEVSPTGASLVDQTVMRAPVAPTASASTSHTGDDSEPTHPRPRRRLVLPIILTLVTAAIVGAVVIGIALSGTGIDGSDLEIDPEPSTPTGEAAVVPEVIDPPVVVDPPARDGTSVVFSVANPAPADNDQMLWRISNRGASEPLRTVDAGEVVVSDVADGSNVCIEVSVRRAGKLSDALEICFP